MKKYKVFWKAIDEKKQVEFIEWNENKDDYYTFVKTMISNDYHQVSITGDMMISMISSVSYNPNIFISSIEFMNDEIDEIDYINEIIKESKNDRRKILKVIDVLRDFDEEDYAVIKRVSFFEKDGNQGFVQINGLVSTNKPDAELMHETRQYIKGYFE